LKEDEVVVFSWIIYKSKENRDRINKLVMEDPMMKTLIRRRGRSTVSAFSSQASSR
jgi:uncharacterized protein YbaA (DUF1428 family)